MNDKNSWIDHLKSLLEKEHSAEIDASKSQIETISTKSLEAKGNVLSRLNVEELCTGLFGRPCIILTSKCKQGIDSSLPFHSFSSGDSVGIWRNSDASSGQIASGVVNKVTTSKIQVALDEESNETNNFVDEGLVRLYKLGNDVTYRRIKQGLNKLEKGVNGRASHLVDVLLEKVTPFEPLPSIPSQLLDEKQKIILFNGYLGPSQVAAVEFSLRQKDLAIIHGPPGTGKTTTIVEVILQHLKLESKVLAVAPSNLAADNLLEKLVASGVSVVRVGHPARVTPQAQQRSLDALVQNSDEYELLRDIRNDIKTSLTNLSKTRDKGRRFRIKGEIKAFRKELRMRETRGSHMILCQSQAVITTLASAGDDGPLKLLPDDHFDLVVIDECSQGLEYSCYLAAMKAPKLLLAGDHRQLPPTVLSVDAAESGLLVSLMERIVDSYKNKVTRMLTTQYRMNEAIMQWASTALYDGHLEAHSSVAGHLLKDLEGVEATEETETALCFVDTAGCGFEEMSGEDLSKGNEGEASLVVEVVGRLIRAGVKENHVAVISPYNLQGQLIRSLIRDRYPLIEVRSVDGFQGREKEAVVISLVRSNKQGEIGFLGEDRRLNVAVTRARRHLTIIGDSDTVCRQKFIRSLVDHVARCGVIRSAHEFESEIFLPNVQKCSNTARWQNDKQCSYSNSLKQASYQINKVRTPITEEEKQQRKKFFEKKIEDFVSSPKASIEFPANLTALERLLVHEIAQSYGLEHGSHGEGKERRILLTKIGQINSASRLNNDESNSTNEKTERKCGSGASSTGKLSQDFPNSSNLLYLVSEDYNTLPIKPIINDSESKLVQKMSKNLNIRIKNGNINSKEKQVESTCSVTSLEDVDAKHLKNNKVNYEINNKTSSSHLVHKKLCEICHKEIPVRNFEIHFIRCEKMLKEKDIKAELDLRKKQIGGSRKKRTDQNSEEEIDDFKIMEQFAKENQRCAYPGCKNHSILFLQLCPFCKINFCLKHHLAEVHGCGEEARSHARSGISKTLKNGVLSSGCLPLKKLDATKRSQLERKLDKKLNVMGDERKTKKKK